MFKYLIEQLQNASRVIYDGAQCRAFLIQAYQESLSIRPSLKKDSEKKLLERFYSVNKDLIELSDNRFNTKQMEYRAVIEELIKDMQSCD
ncbi:hypothetical protein [Pediococcus claussenii]|uniref:Uncharacterized protein n=1 Tax=Pediococcus claussenii (strain ATCC BAA-344 / DSM 14800 / JCM 18046 / KCTC 3811 / LMG 21948 / P06) TaxID=701521 RepID=G8PBT3_PEDCP|nr:hypothetical protein [Pediococcus claussenii]AEV95991.1 hypothetical protein PECL_1778 [Pediococcus claussenii ATCC BAA-344]ANZ69477.1 hypothetical protein AYR57_03760 [Pediococcus claussenii]ANZ71296.1 hypothetical protein AYR58_03775 [Pediococcus claussenii]KRN20597.1 hypothetical protein IV79_GL000656 [Pediococcus claussenii]